MRVLKKDSYLNHEEHKQLAAHFYAIRDHIEVVLHMLNGKVRARWLRLLVNASSCVAGSRYLSQLRCDLEEDFFEAGFKESPYYGNGANLEHPEISHTTRLEYTIKKGVEQWR